MPTVQRRLLAITTALALASAGCGLEGEIPDLRADGQYEALAPTEPLTTDVGPSPAPTATSEEPTEPSETETEPADPASSPEASPEASPTPTPEPSPSPTRESSDDGQTFVVEPDGATAGAGEGVEFAMTGRYDDGDLPGSIDVVLVVCEDVEERDGTLRFIDANDEGTADGRLSDTTRARIVELNGTAVIERASVSDLRVRDGRARVTVEATECVWVVFFDDTDGDAEVEVDGEDVPEEIYGAAKLDI